jgi:hypothetical protein
MLFVAFGTQDLEQREGAVAAQWSTDRGSRASEVKDDSTCSPTCSNKQLAFHCVDKEVAPKNHNYLIEHPPRASSMVVYNELY